MDTRNNLVIGRPFGGVGILWRKSLGPSAVPILYDNCRLLGLELCNDNLKLLIVNTYLPCSSAENDDDYAFYLSKIDSIIGASDTNCCMVMGDFNADLSMDSHGIVSQLFGRKLLAYCQTETLTISDYELMDLHNTYTHVSTSHKTTSWLDHIISTSSFHDLIEKISVDYTLISSDHLPMSVILNLDCARVATKEQPSGCGKGTIKWDKLSAADKNKYEELSDVNMSAIKLKLSSVMCDDPHCKDSFHIAAIDGMYNDVLSAF